MSTIAAKPGLLSDAVQAIRLGQKSLAREILGGILRVEARNEHAYIWSAAIAESPEEAIRLLERVLEINPGNRLASNTLAAQRLQHRANTPPPPPPLPVPTPPVSALVEPVRAPVIPIAAPTVVSTYDPPPRPAPRSVIHTGLSVVRLAPVPAVQPCCPLCLQTRVADVAACPSCGALSSLQDLPVTTGSNGVNVRLIEECIRNWMGRLDVSPTFDAYMGIGLGYLNLNRSGEALPFLRQAVSLRPQDARLRQFNDQLAARKLILIVDDSATVRRLVSITLERQGNRVRTATDGVDGLAKFEEEMPDLVLLDITMPEMDGYELCKRLRRQPSAKKLPILMLSGNDGFFDKVRGKMAGATDYLTKPFQSEVLSQSLKKYLQVDAAKSGFCRLGLESGN